MERRMQILFVALLFLAIATLVGLACGGSGSGSGGGDDNDRSDDDEEDSGPSFDDDSEENNDDDQTEIDDDDDDDNPDDDSADEPDQPLECTETVCTDPNNGLMWQRMGLYVSGWGAADACAELWFDGLNDWRAPTINELRGMIRGCSKTETGGACKVSDECTDFVDCYDFDDCSSGCVLREGPDDGCFNKAGWTTDVLRPICNGSFAVNSVEDRDSSYFVSFLNAGLFVFGWSANETVMCVREAK